MIARLDTSESLLKLQITVYHAHPSFCRLLLLIMNDLGEPLNPEGDSGTDGIRATYAGAKRRIASLEEELKTLRELGSKRKS